MTDVITSIIQLETSPPVFKVYRQFGDNIRVNADDELAAYKAALNRIKEEEMNIRVLYVCFTVVVIAAICAITYGCSQPSNMQLCLAAGKRWNEIQTTTSSRDKPDVRQTVCQ